jgi:DNA-binding CsgD family transcriptional regulator
MGVGKFGALVFGMSALGAAFEALGASHDPVAAPILFQACAALLLLLTAFRFGLRLLQCLIFGAMIPFEALFGAGKPSALVFVIILVTLLSRAGYFVRGDPITARVLTIAVTAGIAMPTCLSHPGVQVLLVAFAELVTAIAAVRAFSIGKVPSALMPSKALFDLRSAGLSERERSFSLAASRGREIKEIAAQYEVSMSTVRNTLASSYRKLHISGIGDLRALNARFVLIDGEHRREQGTTPGRGSAVRVINS